MGLKVCLGVGSLSGIVGMQKWNVYQTATIKGAIKLKPVVSIFFFFFNKKQRWDGVLKREVEA
jgi:hypothetical protein